MVSDIDQTNMAISELYEKDVKGVEAKYAMMMLAEEINIENISVPGTMLRPWQESKLHNTKLLLTLK